MNFVCEDKISKLILEEDGEKPLPMRCQAP